MIPQTVLENIKPLAEQRKREMMVNQKRKYGFRKARLTNTKRQWAFFGSSGFRNMKDYKGPKGQRSFGNPPMEERKK